MCETAPRRLALRSVDREIAEAIEAEQRRQAEHLDAIASENHCPAAVLDAAASVLTDKYAEGYPGDRYYGGCECVDVVEKLAIQRARELFGAEYANVQPHSGSQANMAVYMAVLRPGDRVLGMSLAHGGHLTHGHSRNFSGQLYEVISYGVNDDGIIDYEEVRTLARRHNPAMIIAGASSYSRAIDFEAFGTIAAEVGAYLLADIAHIAGLVAADLHPSPIPHADFVTTTTHKTLRGPRGAIILCRAEYGDRVDSAVMPGVQGGPMMHVIAAKAVALKLAMEPEFRRYQEQVVANARAMAEEFLAAGVPIVSGGTDTHMCLLDLSQMGMTGEEAVRLLAQANITVNKNAIPNDRRKPSEASGIRVGTPALTARGLGEQEVRTVARWIVDVLRADDPGPAAEEVKAHVLETCRCFPIPR
ncbi:MAG: serine hydroxymethyltransferase [Candidatus Brocadiaceae bacterium]|jgi:glycine hydroxymethyltransferase